MPVQYTPDSSTSSEAPKESSFWWRREGKAVAESITAALKTIDSQQMYRAQKHLRHLRLYGNTDVAGLDLGGYWRSESGSAKPNQVALNAISSCIDTAAAKVAKNRPRPSFQTFGGDWGKQQSAKKLGRFCQGAFYETKTYEHSQLAFLLAEIWGTGILHPFQEHGRLKVECVPVPELKVDDAEAVHGEPRQMHRVKHVARELLEEEYADDKDALQAVKDTKRADANGIEMLGDMIQVRESWHLPSCPVDPDDEEAVEDTDGLHVLSVEGGVLYREPWTKDYFPFAVLRWKKMPFGWHGVGVAEELTGIQLAINRLVREIDETLRLVSKGRIFLPEGSGIPKEHMRGGSGAIGDVIQVRGPNMPVVQAMNAVPPEQFAQLDRYWARAFELVGVSQMSAGAKKPAGLDSGAALREFNDIESERFALVGQEWERFHMQLAKLFIDLARELAQEKDDEGKTRGYAVKVPGKRFLESIDWADIDLAEDAYVMQVFPVSSLPTTPAARTQTVQEWIKAGFVTPAEGRRLLEFPDLEASTSLAVAALDDVDATIDAILDKGEKGFHPPEEYQALDLLLGRATSALLRARHDGVPEDRQELLRRLITETASLIERQTQKAAAQQPPPMGPPGAGPPLPPGGPAPAAPMPPLAPPVLQ